MDHTDEPTDLQARIAILEERLAELEARDQEEEGLEPLFGRLFPSEARRHMRAARKEQLLAARAFLDHWIDRIEREPADRLRRRESIKLE